MKDIVREIYTIGEQGAVSKARTFLENSGHEIPSNIYPIQRDESKKEGCYFVQNSGVLKLLFLDKTEYELPMIIVNTFTDNAEKGRALKSIVERLFDTKLK